MIYTLNQRFNEWLWDVKLNLCWSVRLCWRGCGSQCREDGALGLIGDVFAKFALCVHYFTVTEQVRERRSCTWCRFVICGGSQSWKFFHLKKEEDKKERRRKKEKERETRSDECSSKSLGRRIIVRLLMQRWITREKQKFVANRRDPTEKEGVKGRYCFRWIDVHNKLVLARCFNRDLYWSHDCSLYNGSEYSALSPKIKRYMFGHLRTNGVFFFPTIFKKNFFGGCAWNG